ASWRARSRETGSVPKATPSAIASARATSDRATTPNVRVIARSDVALVEDAQTRQREVVVDLLDRAGERHDQPRQPAGRDGRAGGEGHLLDEAIDEAVDEAHVAEDDARLHRVLRVAPYHLRRTLDLHTRQLRGTREQRIGADIDPGRDHAAHVLALRR